MYRDRLESPCEGPRPRNPTRRIGTNHRPAERSGGSLPPAGKGSYPGFGTGDRHGRLGGRGMTIREASSALRSGRLSSVELTTAAAARIERTNPALNAFI